MPAGRPNKYTLELAKDICEKTAVSSKSLKTICEELNIRVRTVLDWLNENEEFSLMYARAKGEQADFLAEEILEIADDKKYDVLRAKKVKNSDGSDMILLEENKEFTNRSRLRVDARKWIASKLKPRKYGDRLDLTTQGDKLNHGPMQVEIVKPDEE